MYLHFFKYSAVIAITFCYCTTLLFGQNTALEFNGVDNYVDLGNEAGDGLRTIELWFKPSNDINSSSIQDFQALVARNNGQTTNADEFDISFTYIGANAGKIQFRMMDGAGNAYHVYSDSSVWKKDQWNHVAAVVDPLMGMMLFINGKKQLSTTNYNSPTANISKITTVGCWGDEYVRNFEGCIDDIRFSSTALYTADFIPPCPDLKADITTGGLWNFNGSSVTIAIDSSTNAFDGSIYSAGRAEDSVCQPVTTGIHDLSHLARQARISVYPNPSQGVFFFDLGDLRTDSDITIFIYDVFGRLIAKETANTKLHQLVLSDENQGVLTFRVSTNDQVLANGRLVKY